MTYSVSDVIIPPIHVIMVNGTFWTVDSSTITIQCLANYNDALRAAGQTMVSQLAGIVGGSGQLCTGTEFSVTSVDVATSAVGMNVSSFKLLFNPYKMKYSGSFVFFQIENVLK